MSPTAPPPQPLATDTVEIGPGLPLDAARQMFRHWVRLVRRDGRVVREICVDCVAGTTAAEAAAQALEQMRLA